MGAFGQRTAVIADRTTHRRRKKPTDMALRLHLRHQAFREYHCCEPTEEEMVIPGPNRRRREDSSVPCQIRRPNRLPPVLFEASASEQFVGYVRQAAPPAESTSCPGQRREESWSAFVLDLGNLQPAHRRPPIPRCRARDGRSGDRHTDRSARRATRPLVMYVHPGSDIRRGAQLNVHHSKAVRLVAGIVKRVCSTADYKETGRAERPRRRVELAGLRSAPTRRA